MSSWFAPSGFKVAMATVFWHLFLWKEISVDSRQAYCTSLFLGVPCWRWEGGRVEVTIRSNSISSRRIELNLSSMVGSCCKTRGMHWSNGLLSIQEGKIILMKMTEVYLFNYCWCLNTAIRFSLTDSPLAFPSAVKCSPKTPLKS